MKFFSTPKENMGRPEFPWMTPLIDVLFNTLILFMTLSIFYQLEYALSISVPKAVEAKEAQRSPGEIVINVMKDGSVVVNDKQVTRAQLGAMLVKISSLFPNQAVIIRADKRAYHEYVVSVLDACAGANIWNIAFSTVKEEKRKASRPAK